MSSRPDPDNQSITEVVVRTLATHVFGLLLYGHLGSLQRVPARIHAKYLFLFLFFPGIIVAQLVIGVVRAVQHAAKDQVGVWQNLSFYFHGILGVRTTTNPGVALDNNEGDGESAGIPLFCAGHSSLSRTTVRLSWAWFGRVLGCLTFIAQAVGASVVFVRREQHGCDLAIERIIGIMAFASVVTGNVSLALLLTRSEWTLVRPVPGEQREDRLKAPLVFLGLLLHFLMTRIYSGSYLFWFIYPLRYVRTAQFMVAGLFIYIFCHAVSKKSRILSVLFGLGALLSVCLLAIDIVSSLVTIVQQVVSAEHGCWKDSLSEMILVI